MGQHRKRKVSPPLCRDDTLFLLGVLFVSVVLYWPMFAGRPVMPDTWMRFEPWNTELGLDGPLDPAIKQSNNDAILLYVPWNAFVHRELRAGRLPGWDPCCLMGVPLAANHLAPVFYPVYALLAWLLSPLFIMGASGFVHTLILGVFTYLFLREWLSSLQGKEEARFPERFAAWIASSSLMVSAVPNPHYQPWPMTLAFFPGIWFFFERWLRHGRRVSGIWMAFCWAVPLTAGYPSLVFQLGLFTIVWILLRPAMTSTDMKSGCPTFVRRLNMVVWPLVLGIGLSGVQNVPTVLVSRESDRTFFKSAEELAREESFTVPPNQPWQLYVKKFTQPLVDWKFPANDFFNRGFLGLVPVALAAYSLGRIRDRGWPKLTLLLAVIVAPAALVPEVNFRLYSLLKGATIDPNPPIEVLAFLLTMLAAAGARYWADEVLKDCFKVDWPLMLSTLVILFYSIAHLKSRQTLLPPEESALSALVLIVWLFVLPLTRRKERVTGSSWAVFSLAALSPLLAAFLMSYNVLAPPLPPEAAATGPMPRTTSISAVLDLCSRSESGGWGRLIRWDPGPVNVMSLHEQPYLFYPNLGTYFGIPDLFGYFNLAPRNRMDYLRSIEPDAVVERRGIVAFTAPETLCERSISFAGARYLLVKPGINFESSCWQKLYSGPGIEVYVNSASWPRAVLLGPGEELEQGKPPDQSQVQIVTDLPGRVVIRLTQPPESERVLVLNEAWAGGWTAEVDGKPAGIDPVGGLLMSVRVPAGAQVVEFRYSTPGLRAGALISALTLVLCIVLVLTGRRY